jgi:hypothetical protein
VLPLSGKPAEKKHRGINVVTRDILEKVNTFNFPVFQLDVATHRRPLSTLSTYLVVESGLLGNLSLPADKFASFIVAIEKGYDSTLSCNSSN